MNWSNFCERNRSEKFPHIRGQKCEFLNLGKKFMGVNYPQISYNYTIKLQNRCVSMSKKPKEMYVCMDINQIYQTKNHR